MTNATEERVWVSKVFAHAQLPAHLQAVSTPFGDLAQTLLDTLPFGRERTKALDRLLESKDAAVRALVLGA
jgi:hypothetical protein